MVSTFWLSIGRVALDAETWDVDSDQLLARLHSVALSTNNNGR
jgi:hypothetical protein